MESQEIINISLIVLVIFLIMYVICLNMKVNNMSETFVADTNVENTGYSKEMAPEPDDKKFGISEAIKNLGCIAKEIQDSKGGVFTFPANVIIPGDVTIQGKLSVGKSKNDDENYTLSVDDGKTTINSKVTTINGQTNLVNKIGNPLTTVGEDVVLNSNLNIEKDLTVNGQVESNLKIKGELQLTDGEAQTSTILQTAGGDLKLIPAGQSVEIPYETSSYKKLKVRSIDGMPKDGESTWGIDMNANLNLIKDGYGGWSNSIILDNVTAKGNVTADGIVSAGWRLCGSHRVNC